MKERPILFSGPMVRALLAGTKTQTRRIIKPQPVPIQQAVHERLMAGLYYHNDFAWHRCAGVTTISNKPNGPDSWARDFSPFGQPGDQLWVREAHAIVPSTAYRCSSGVHQIVNPGDADMCAIYAAEWERSAPKWKPSIHMPRWASRITLEITGVRVERLQAISEEDAKAEGCVGDHDYPGVSKDGEWHFTSDCRHKCSAWMGSCRSGADDGIDPFGACPKVPAVPIYRDLWESLNGPSSWDLNSLVWVIEFKRVTP